MSTINKILSRITLLYYIFIVVLIADFGYSVVTGFIEGFTTGEKYAQQLASVDPTQFLITTIWSFFVLAVYIVVLVLFVLLIVSLGKSIANKNIFNPKTIKYINRYAFVYAISLAMMFADQFIGAASRIAMHEVIMNILSGASTIVMLLLFGQVLRIGKILKAETDLTI